MVSISLHRHMFKMREGSRVFLVCEVPTGAQANALAGTDC